MGIATTSPGGDAREKRDGALRRFEEEFSDALRSFWSVAGDRGRGTPCNDAAPRRVGARRVLYARFRKRGQVWLSSPGAL